MSTGPIQPENTDSAAQPVSPTAASEQATPPAMAPDAAQSSAANAPLPPRIDGGEDLDNVLGEVSRIFGQAAGHASPLAALAQDTINDHLADLTAVDKPQSADTARSLNQDVPVESAADLFRALSPVEETPISTVEIEPAVPETPLSLTEVMPTAAERVTAEGTIEPSPVEGSGGDADTEQAASSDDSKVEADFAASPDPVPDSAPEMSATVAQSAEPAEAAPAAATTVEPARKSVRVRVLGVAQAGIGALRRMGQRIPKRGKFAAGLMAAAILGWIAGASLRRSSSAPIGVEKHAGEIRGESAPPEHDAEQSKIASLEEQLQKLGHERGVAQHERDQARERLEKSAVLLRTQQQSVAADRARDESTRKQALDEYQKSAERVNLFELRAYDAQLARVRDCWQRKPGLAAALLEDSNGCPPKLRDFTWGYFYGRAKSDCATWTASGPINAVAWSPDGKLVASAGRDGSIGFRDAVSGKVLTSIPAHTGGVSGLAFSHHGEWLASAGADSTVKLWDVATRQLQATFFGHLGTVLSVAVSPDASLLVSGGDDGTVKFWDVASRRAVATRWGHPRNQEPDADDPSRFVRAVVISPDGRLVASGGYRVARIWDADAVEKSTLAVPDGSVSALAFSPDGSTLALGTEGSITLRDVDSLLLRSGPQPVQGPVSALTFSDDGAWLAAAADEHGLLFNRIARRERDDLENKLGPKIASEPARYDLANPRRLTGHDGPVTGIAFAPGGQITVTGGTDGTIRLWNPRGGIIDKTRPDFVLRDLPQATALSYSPDSRCLAVGTADTVRLWNVRDGVEIARLANRSGDVTRLAFSPDGAFLASASRDWPILIWSVDAQRIKLALNGHTAGVNSLGYATDGKTLISAGDDGTVRLWDAANGHALACLTGHAGSVLSAAFSPDSKLAASAGVDRTVRLWSVERKQTVATLAGHDGPAVALAFSPDGRFLVTAEGRAAAQSAGTLVGQRRPIRLWSVPEGKPLFSFGVADADIRDLAFSPDSKTLAVSDFAGVTLWDARTGEIRETLPLLAPAASNGQWIGSNWRADRPVAFSPDGRSLAAGGDAALVLWSAAPFSAGPVEKAAAPIEKTAAAP